MGQCHQQIRVAWEKEYMQNRGWGGVDQQGDVGVRAHSHKIATIFLALHTRNLSFLPPKNYVLFSILHANLSHPFPSLLPSHYIPTPSHLLTPTPSLLLHFLSLHLYYVSSPSPPFPHPSILSTPTHFPLPFHITHPLSHSTMLIPYPHSLLCPIPCQRTNQFYVIISILLHFTFDAHPSQYSIH